MKWTHTLYTKLATGLILVLLIIGVLYGMFATVLTTQLSQRAEQHLNRDLAANLVADKRIVIDGKIDKKALKGTFMEYMSINPSIEIYFLDKDGTILSYSAEAGVVKRRAVSLVPIKAFLDNTSFSPILGEDPRSHERRKPFSVTPLPSAENPTGYLYVVLQGEEFASAQASQAQRYGISMSVFAVLASLLIGLIMGLLIFKFLSVRIRSLQEKVSSFAESGFQDTSLLGNEFNSRENGDEIDELEKHFHQMSQHISGQWAALSQQDHLRREMIANISHDLRTPLASAKGYLETIALKADTLSEEEKQRYLKISINQTKRLQNLIDQLFELVKLEARDTRVDFESFSILELVYDVVSKFSLKAKEKNISLNVSSSATDAEVLADIGLIERVLDNLIGNALHYVPDNHRVWVEIETCEAGKIHISVNDDGNGISSKQQALIFNRFHRADNPQRTSTGNAGLGLAIVKKIMDLHEQTIKVESAEGKGASFTFTLSCPN